MLTYALPGSLVMAESMLVGASLLNIFLAVWFVNARLYPMTVSLFPLMMHKSQPKWKYYFSCHFILLSWCIFLKNNVLIPHQSIPKFFLFPQTHSKLLSDSFIFYCSFVNILGQIYCF